MNNFQYKINFSLIQSKRKQNNLTKKENKKKKTNIQYALVQVCIS